MRKANSRGDAGEKVGTLTSGARPVVTLKTNAKEGDNTHVTPETAWNLEI